MFFRFASALVLVVLISLAGTALEKRSLELRRIVSRQQYRLEILLEKHAGNRVLAQQLGAPSRLIDKIDEEPESKEKSPPTAKPARPGARKASHKPKGPSRRSP